MPDPINVDLESQPSSLGQGDLLPTQLVENRKSLKELYRDDTNRELVFRFTKLSGNVDRSEADEQEIQDILEKDGFAPLTEFFRTMILPRNQSAQSQQPFTAMLSTSKPESPPSSHTTQSLSSHKSDSHSGRTEAPSGVNASGSWTTDEMTPSSAEIPGLPALSEGLLSYFQNRSARWRGQSSDKAEDLESGKTASAMHEQE